MAKMFHQVDEGSAVQIHPVSCLICRSKKSRCDRVLPRCSTCATAQRSCSYPQRIQKPGPKPGRSYPRPCAKSTLTINDGEGETTSKERDRRTRTQLHRRRRSETHLPSSSPDPSSVTSASSTQANDLHKISFLIHPSHDAVSSTGTRPTSPCDVPFGA